MSPFVISDYAAFFRLSYFIHCSFPAIWMVFLQYHPLLSHFINPGCASASTDKPSKRLPLIRTAYPKMVSNSPFLLGNCFADGFAKLSFFPANQQSNHNSERIGLKWNL